MTAKVSLIYADNNFQTVGEFPPLGGLYIISFLKQKGIDANYHDFPIIKNWKKRIHEILDSNPDVIGLSSTVSNYSNTQFLARYIKSFNKDIKIIVGGPYPTGVPEKYLQNEAIDAICMGEGEHTLYKYLIEGDKADGLMIRKNGHFFRTKPRPRIENLDDLPFPDLSQVDLRKYHYIFKKRKPLSTIMTSRGCPYNCIYCFHEVHGHKWRARSPKNVLEEIKWQYREFGVRELAFWDDNLTMDQKRAEKICDLLIQEKVDISMSTPNGIRVDKVNKILLSKMRRAGFWVIVLTPETGDPYIMEKLRKGFTLKQTERVARWCKELDLFLVIYLMMGFPFETKEHVQNSLNFIKKIKPDIFNVNKFYPFPKTPIVNEYDLKTDEDYDYRIKKMSKEFEKLLNSAYFQFFSNPHNLANIIRKVGVRRFFYSIYRVFKADITNRFKRTDYSKMV
ncbi:MAG: cobalamin B12-binding domain-containing protein [Candidatus Helarchaeota archaeon]|nr:cobalamin B12-binding domain-containing protein [Candidatus Helarchaeota archaeon]